MVMSICHLVTGELESPLAGALVNSGVCPGRTSHEAAPYGYGADVRRPDGTRVEGVVVPVPVWYVRGSEGGILIDAGLGDPERVAPVLAAYGNSGICRRSPGQRLEEALAGIGVRAADIKTVVLTHLHFDHIGDIDALPNARIIVQREELEVGLEPEVYMAGSGYYAELSAPLRRAQSRFEVIDGDCMLDRDVQLLKIGGHSPGCMAVVVATAIGSVAIASDLVHNYRNLELDWPTGFFWCLGDLLAGVGRLRSVADVILPNHDWYIRQVYRDGVIG